MQPLTGPYVYGVNRRSLIAEHLVVQNNCFNSNVSKMQLFDCYEVSDNHSQ